MNITELEKLAKAATPGPWYLKYLSNFLSKICVDEKTGCWNWTAATSGHVDRMYGCFWVGKAIKAHQYSMLLKQGFRTEKAIVCHTCDNTICCNPDHLYEGSHSDNVRDAVVRGRHKNGEMSKTHCPSGHPYSEGNVYEYVGQRQCKTCRDIHRGRTPKNYF